MFSCGQLCLPTDEGEKVEKKQGSGDEERKPRRKAYVHKPFLYSRYYSDSDDEVTVEERRRSVVSSIGANRIQSPYCGMKTGAIKLSLLAIQFQLY